MMDTESKPTLIHMLASNRWGGVERYALDICRYFHEEGWNVIVVTREARAVDSMFERAGIPLLHAPLGGLWDFSSISLLTKEIKESKGEVVIHAHDFLNVFTALMARKFSGKTGVKIIMTQHKVRRAVDSWLLRRIYRKVDALVFVSRLARDRFIATWHNRLIPIKADRMYVIHNSLNISLTDYTRPIGNRPITAMFHGPLLQGKGLENLIDAMALLKGKRIRLRIVGSGTPDYLDKLRRRAISKGVMEMIDWHKHTDNPLPLISDCDFGVLPSVMEEAFGLANIEYMATGRPQICSSNGAQPEYLTDGWEGFLIPPGNISFLADSILKLASDPELRDRMGKRAFETFRNRLAWSHFIEPLKRIYISQPTE